MSSLYILLVVGIFLSSFLGTYFYRELAVRKGFLANPNCRTLHEQPTPRGGGIIFSLLFVLTVMSFGFFKIIDYDLVFALGVGGGIASIFGFIDDLVNIRALIKLIVQGCLSAWIIFCFDGGPLVNTGWLPVWFSYFISWISLVWLINLYNFMDGVDGMASSGTVFICAMLILILFATNGSSSLLLLFSLLLAGCLGFLLLNWPPASIFMGDSGSVFLGYCFGVFIFKTVIAGDISFLTWLIVLGYFIGDTTTTTVIRIFKVKRWYGAHRSHAYQNLARICDSHLKVTVGVICYHIFWILPLAIWSVLVPNMASIAVILALLPSICWTFKFGPLLSSK